MFKKITFFLSCISLGLQAQYSENFENGVPGSMTQSFVNGAVSFSNCGGNLGGVTCPMSGTSSASFYEPSFSANATSLSTPNIDLSSGRPYQLKFLLAQPEWNGDQNTLSVDISTNGGGSWFQIGSYSNSITIPEEQIINLTSVTLSSTTQIRFVVTNAYGYATLLDDISIVEIPSEDVEMVSIDVPNTINSGGININGVFRNSGNSTINSLDLNYQLNGGLIYTQSLSSLNLSTGNSFNFSHDEVWNASIGTYSLNVWVSNVNGNGLDDVSSNDLLSKTINVTDVYTRRPLFETYSSSTCGPCATFDNNAFNTSFKNLNDSKMTYIKFPVNWPGAGDPYAEQFCSDRVSYYGVNGAPTTYLDGSQYNGGWSSTALESALNSRINSGESNYKIDAIHSINGQIININVDVTSKVTQQAILHVVVFEGTTSQNIGTNGQTQFYHITMKMVPGSAGAIHNFTAGLTDNFTFTADMSSTNIESDFINDAGIVVFLQEPGSGREIYQSNYSNEVALGIQDGIQLAKTSIFPNPSSDLFKIRTNQEFINVEICDLNGRAVLSQNNLKSGDSVSIDNLNYGLYVVKLSTDSQEKFIKLVKN